MIFMVLVCGVPAVYAEEPLEALKKPINESLQILKDPQYQADDQKEEQRERFWAVIREIFDFTELSKRALARNWRLFSAEEKREFTEVFAELLGNTYVDKIQSEFQNEKVVYLGQEKIKKARARVKTKIIRENVAIPIDYNLVLKNGQWKVYDVYVEGVSLVKNYRTQFNKILFKKTPGQLIQRLKKKVEKQKKMRQTSRASGFKTVMVVCLACGQNQTLN